MTPGELEAYLHEHIPLTKAMELRVANADAVEVRLSAPLDPNVNHQGTAFGGSIAVLAIVTGWCVTRLCLGADAQIVVHKGEIEYLQPIKGQLDASCEFPPEEELRKLGERLAKRGRVRTTLEVRLESEGKLCARLVGKYVGTLSEGKESG